MLREREVSAGRSTSANSNQESQVPLGLAKWCAVCNVKLEALECWAAKVGSGGYVERRGEAVGDGK